MKIKLFPSFIMFLASYLPLSLILLVQDFDMQSLQKDFCYNLNDVNCNLPFKNPHLAVGFLLICCLSLMLTIILIKNVSENRVIVLIKAKHLPTDLINYVIPYIVSFMSLDYSQLEKMASFFLFLIWLFWITHASGRVIYNPILIAFGWRLYEVDYSFLGNEKMLPNTGFALARGVIEPNAEVRMGTLQDVIIIQRGKK